LWISVFALGCTGTIGWPGGSDGPNGAGSGSGANNPGGGSTTGNGGGGSNGPVTGSEVMVEPSWRLTNAEYVNSVKDLLGVEITSPLDPDASAAGFSAGLVAGDSTVAAYHTAAMQASAQTAALTKLVPCDQAAITATPADCAGKFIDAIGPKAFRRPLDAGTRAGLLDTYTKVSTKFGFNAGIQGVVEHLLQSPYFLYHLELEEQAKGPGKVAVSGYSMASRLSYLIWASMPDDQLLQKAAAGTLSTTDQIQAEAARMLVDPRAKVGLRNFYEQWLRVTDIPLAKTGKYATSYDNQMQADIKASFDAQVDAALWSPTNGLTTLLTGTQAFVNASLAPIFGVTGVTGTALQPVTVNAQQRVGILAHPAIMATFATANGSHPIRRGVFVWDQIVCQALPDPPANVPAFPGVPANSSVRQAFETFTSPNTCQGCHRRINPVGFLFENYDTVGAYRTTDDVNQPVNSSVTIVDALTSSGDPDAQINGPANSAVELANRLAADTSISNHCMVTQLYRYATRRIENDADGVTIDKLAGTYAQASQDLTKLIGGLTQTPAFLNRLNEQ